MTKRISDGKTSAVIFEQEAASKCDLCGKVKELRPYGPNGEQVCFECGMLDEPAATRAFEGLLRGPVVVKDASHE